MHVNPFTYAHPVSPLADMGERIRAAVFAPRVDASAALAASGTLSAMDASGHTPGGRVSLLSGNATPTADTTSTTVYYVPYRNARVPLWNGSTWVSTPLGTPSVAIGTVTAGTVFDIFAYLSAGMVLIEKLAWTNATTRATAVDMPAGTGAEFPTKNGDKTRLYVGTVVATTTTTVPDTLSERCVWNMYNRVPKVIRALETADFWTYGSSTLRPLNNNTNNRVRWVLGQDEDCIDIGLFVPTVSSSGSIPTVAIGIDSTTAAVAGCIKTYTQDNGISTATAASIAAWRGNPGIGYRYAQALEASSGGTPTFVGDTALTTVQAGIHALGMF